MCLGFLLTLTFCKFEEEKKIPFSLLGAGLERVFRLFKGCWRLWSWGRGRRRCVYGVLNNMMYVYDVLMGVVG